MKTGNVFDKMLILCSVLYITVPIVLFLFGWLNLFLAIIITLILGYFCITLYMELIHNNTGFFSNSRKEFWYVVLLLLGIWVYMSGIGGFAYQNGDFWARNPMYRDLCNSSWPVIYDLSTESDIIQKIAGNEKVMFSYYFSWWLVPAIVTKVFHLGNLGRNVCLYLYALSGVFLVVYNMTRFFHKTTYLAPLLLIAFSGLDVVAYWLINNTIPVTEHIEWWSKYFQYSSNTTLLYWVFNQSVPIWLIVILILQIKENKISGLASLSFAYSPWATIGLIPFAFSSILLGKKKIMDSVTWQNIIIPLIMLIAYGFFYIAGNGTVSGSTGSIFTLFPNEKRAVLMNYLLFIFFEIGVFFLTMGKELKGYPYYYVVLLELLLFPLYRVIQYSSLIRGSIPALFLLMIYCILFLLNSDENHERRVRKRFLIMLLCIGAFTPSLEIRRSIVNTTKNINVVNESVYSFSDIKTDNEGIITEIKNLYFIYNYEDSLYYKFLAKK